MSFASVCEEIFCTKTFLALVSHGVKTGTCHAAGKPGEKGPRRQCSGTAFLTSPSLHAHLPQLCSCSCFLPFPWKSVFPSFSLSWATAGAFHITAQLANFLILFFLPHDSLQRVVHPDELPWLAFSPDSPKVRAEYSKWVRERQREQKLKNNEEDEVAS